MTEYQVTYNDNVEINGNLKTNNIDVNTGGILNVPTVNSSTVNTTDVNTTNMDAVSITFTNNLTSTNGSITITNGNVSTTNGSLIGDVKSDIIDPETSNGTTTISKPKIPTTLTVSNPAFVPLLDSTGILGLLSASSGSNGQVLSTNGTNISWQTVSGGGGGSGSILGWATLVERLQNGNNALYYNGSSIISSAELGLSNTATNFNRVFTEITNSSSNPITSTSTANYTSGSINYTCRHNFTLGSGTYIISGSFPAGIPSSGNSSFVKHRVNLQNGSNVVLSGTSEVTKAVSKTLLNGIITLSSSTTLTIIHSVFNDGNTRSNLGLPYGSDIEIYGILTIIKIA